MSYDHWPRIKDRIQNEYYDKVNKYIGSKLEKLNMKDAYCYLYSLENKEQQEKERAARRAIYQYLEFDKLDSTAAIFYKAGYIFWFNFLTICLVFFVLGIFATFVGILYSYFTTLHLLGIRTYFILSWLLVIKTKERGEDTLKWYVSSAILAVDSFIKKESKKLSSAS